MRPRPSPVAKDATDGRNKEKSRRGKQVTTGVAMTAVTRFLYMVVLYMVPERKQSTARRDSAQSPDFNCLVWAGLARRHADQ
jgi:hypothetical protein